MSNILSSQVVAKRYSLIILVIFISGSIIITGIYYALQSTVPEPVSSARNWAGYYVATDLQNPQPGVFEISGSWTVPTISDSGTNSFSAVWVGIGGQFDQTLIQIGTEQDFINGFATYSAWYELLPEDSITIYSLDISPGDQIEASIKLFDSNTNLWTTTLADLTTGQKFQSNFTYDASRLSAEWIVERPLIDNSFSPLANFGNVTFSNCQAIVMDKKGAINDFPSSKIIMDAQVRDKQQVQLVDVSSLSNQGKEFTVEYLSS